MQCTTERNEDLFFSLLTQKALFNSCTSMKTLYFPFFVFKQKKKKKPNNFRLSVV